MKLSLKAVLATLMVALSGLSFANPNPEKLAMMKDVLDLSADQVTAIGTIMNTSAEKAHPHRETMKSLKQQMKQLAEADEVDRKQIKSVATQMADQKTELMLIHLAAKKEMKAQLSAEQQAKFEKLEQHKKHKREKRMKRWHHDDEDGE